MKDIKSDENAKIIKLYRETARKRNVKLQTIFSSIGLIAVPFLMYQDIFLRSLPWPVIYWRSEFLITCIASLIFFISPLKKNCGFVLFISKLNLMSLIIMMCGIIAVITPLDNISIQQGFITGLLLVVFLIYAFSPGGGVTLIPAYSIFIFFIFFYMHLYLGQSIVAIIPLYSNIFIAIVVFTILAEVTEKLRYREFSVRILLEEKNRDINKKNEQLHEQMELARIIQLNMIPQTTPSFSGIKISAVYKPMIEIGGDFYDFIYFMEKNLLGIFIGDVSGHGVPAALITGMVKTIIETADIVKKSPAAFMSYINDNIIGLTSDYFITAVYAVLDTDTNRFTYARAGHCYPILVRENKCTELVSGGSFMGINSNLSVEESEVQLQPGDRLLLYTDGLTECRNRDNAEFGETELFQKLQEMKPAENENFAAVVYNHLIDFCGKEVFKDDICIIGLEIL